jgi:hypothetical protein
VIKQTSILDADLPASKQACLHSSKIAGFCVGSPHFSRAALPGFQPQAGTLNVCSS